MVDIVYQKKLLDQDNLFKETGPWINQLLVINQAGFITESSQPGHADPDNMKNPEHTTRFGYGYCLGKCDSCIAQHLVKTLSNRYRVQYENTIYYKGSFKCYQGTPMMRFHSFEAVDVDPFADFCLLHEEIEGFCCVAEVSPGESTVISDIANVISQSLI
jgi:hypothetical protein